MPTREVITEFDPVLYSEEERAWLLENLGKAPAVALQRLDPAVNRNAVKPLLDRLYELDELQKAGEPPWVGYEVIRESIRVFNREDAKWKADWVRTRGRAPRFPSLYSYDGKGRPHLGGPDSDSGRVRTYFEGGVRKPFSVLLLADVDTSWIAPTIEKPFSEGLTKNEELHRYECFCGHTETWKVGSRASENVARARMSKHLRKDNDPKTVDRHREIHTSEFGQASV
jgi:hypothetical protein